MLISVIIPTFNSESFILKTLHSVLNQTYTNFEIIISDDGSNDKTLAVIKRFFQKKSFEAFQILANSHQGPGATRNAGITRASGKWISFLDSDDIWETTKLQSIVNSINNDNTIDLICHSEKAILLDNSEITYEYYKKLNSEIPLFLSFFRQNALSTSAVTLKKDILVKAGLFDVNLPSSQDYDLWLRISLIPKVKVYYLKEFLGYYMLRNDNISSNYKMRFICLRKILKKYKKSLSQFSPNPRTDYIHFSYKIHKGYCKNLIINKKYIIVLPYLIRLTYLKIMKTIFQLSKNNENR